MTNSPNEKRVIAYWDFENLVRSLDKSLTHYSEAPDGGRGVINKVADFVQRRGYVFINRSFANWPLFGRQGDMMKKMGVEVISEVSVAANGKNGADIQLVIDAVQTVCDGSSRIEEAVLLTGDSDFVPLAIFLRSKGIKVIGISGSVSASRLWREQCDEFFILEDILGIPPAKKQYKDSHSSSNHKSSSSRTPSVKQLKIPVKVRSYLLEIVYDLQGDNGPGANAGLVLQKLNDELPKFDYKKLGVERWSDVVKSMVDDFDCNYTDDKIPQLCLRTRKDVKPRRKSISKSADTDKSSSRSRTATNSSSTKRSSTRGRSKDGRDLLLEAIDNFNNKRPGEQLLLAQLGHELRGVDIKFDPKDYKHSSLKEFLEDFKDLLSLESSDKHGYIVNLVKQAGGSSTGASKSGNGTSRSANTNSNSSSSSRGTAAPRRDKSGLARSSQQAITRVMRKASGESFSNERDLYSYFRKNSHSRITEHEFWQHVKAQQYIIKDVNGDIRVSANLSGKDEPPSRSSATSAGSRSNGNGNGDSRRSNGNGNGNGRDVSPSQQRTRDSEPEQATSEASAPPPRTSREPGEGESGGILGSIRKLFR